MAFRRKLLIQTFYYLFCSLTTVKGESLLSPFHNYGCPPFFNDTSCFNIISSHSNTQRPLDEADLLKAKDVIHVSSLNNILNLLEKTHCLVILTTFSGVTFGELQYPVIMRNLRPALYWYFNFRKSWWSYGRAIYVLDEILKGNINRTDNNEQHFLLDGSKFLRQPSEITLFSVLNIFKFVGETKPWNNLVSISLFPPIHLQVMFHDSSAYFDHYLTPIETIYNIFPSALSPSKVIILKSPEM